MGNTNSKIRTPGGPDHWTEDDARDAVALLEEVLDSAQITLPSLDVDRVSTFQAGRGPLVDLGRVRPDVVQALAEAIRKGSADE
jgi:uncharacterized protein (DUF2461 family)